MCIIAYKPADIELIPEDTYWECFWSNNDGAGFAYWDREAQLWNVRKGFMKWKHFWKAYSEHNFTKEDVIIAHFRIGTSGNRDGGNTHPFPVVTDYDQMRQTEFTAENLIFHNGVIHTKGDGIASDTMFHVKTYIAPLFQLDDKEYITRVLTYILQTTSNRWMLLTKDMIHPFGTWKTDLGGSKFSNDSYKPPVKTHYAGRNSIYSHTTSRKETEEKDKKDASKSKTGIFVDNNGNLKNTRNIGFRGVNVSQASYLADTGEVFFDDIEKNMVVTNCCPNCADDERLNEADIVGYDEADTICHNCGCIFDDHTGKIHDVRSDLIDKEYVS